MGQRYPVPPPAGSYTPAYVPVITYYGGASGDDLTTSSANVTNDFNPKTQTAKAALVGMPIINDVTRRRGAIAPQDRYPAAGDAAVPAPTVTGISPNTGVAGGADVIVRITGTNFTAWSEVLIGGSSAPYRYARVISPTAIDVTMDCRRSVAGTATIVVADHGVTTAPQTFTFT